MLSAMAAWWGGDPAGVDTENLPPRYTTATLMLWTLMGVAVMTAFYLVRFALGSTSPLWLAGLPVMFLPLVLGVAMADVVLVLLLGFAVTALVASWVFGTVTRVPSAPRA